jgi:hypothetical protein
MEGIKERIAADPYAKRGELPDDWESLQRELDDG